MNGMGEMHVRRYLRGMLMSDLHRQERVERKYVRIVCLQF